MYIAHKLQSEDFLKWHIPLKLCQIQLSSLKLVASSTGVKLIQFQIK